MPAHTLCVRWWAEIVFTFDSGSGHHDPLSVSSENSSTSCSSSPVISSIERVSDCVELGLAVLLVIPPFNTCVDMQSERHAMRPLFFNCQVLFNPPRHPIVIFWF